MALTAQDLLAPDYLAGRASLIDPDRAGLPAFGQPGRGGTVCLSGGDSDGMMISFISIELHGLWVRRGGAGYRDQPAKPWIRIFAEGRSSQ